MYMYLYTYLDRIEKWNRHSFCLYRVGQRHRETLTINVPVVYMAWDVVIILMRANPFRGPLEGVGPENRDFFEALK